MRSLIIAIAITSVLVGPLAHAKQPNHNDYRLASFDIDGDGIDDYGYCDACGIENGVQRLEARPTATLCIDCKTLAEIKERQIGPVSTRKKNRNVRRG